MAIMTKQEFKNMAYWVEFKKHLVGKYNVDTSILEQAAQQVLSSLEEQINILESIPENVLKLETWKGKSINDLVQELVNGESTLTLDAEGMPFLTIKVVSCEITYYGKRLVETKRETLMFGESKPEITSSMNPISGKMMIGESGIQAMMRELSEELTIPFGSIKVYEKDIHYVKTESKERARYVYPTLNGRYDFIKFKWVLPDEFYKSQYIEVSNSDTATRTMTYAWVQ